jgi:hypothetical protein
MTQQYYPPQQFPQQPQFPQYPQAPQQGYPQQAPQQQFMPGMQAPPQAPPQQPLVNGNLDDYFNQPGAGTGPSISWKDKPLGTTYVGIVARDVTNGDVQQQTDPSTGAPKFFKDGRPQFVMKVPLKVQPSQEFPQGEATYYVRGQARDELVRAMSEVGCTGAPKGGAAIQVTLVERRPSRMGNPANVVQIQYVPPQGQAQGQDQQAPAQAAPQQAPDASSPAPGPVASQQPAQAPQQLPQQFQAAQPTATLAGQPNPFAQAGAAGADPFPPQPQQQVQAQIPAPEGLSADQQQLLARLTGQQG